MNVLVAARLGIRSAPAARKSAGIIALPTLRQSAGMADHDGLRGHRDHQCTARSRRRGPSPSTCCRVLLLQRATAVIINDGAAHDNATCMLQTVSAYLRSIDQSARSSSPSRAIYA